MTITVFPVDSVSGSPQYTGQMTRQALSALCGWAPSGRPLGANSGVRPGTPTSTVSATGTTWTVGAHSGVLDVETPAGAGPYFYANDTNVTGPVTAANATNPRIDIIYVQLADPAESDGSSTPGVSFQYLAGTAASSPAVPTPPNTRTMVLAQISVPASGGGAPTVTWVTPTYGAVVQHYMTNTAQPNIPNNADTTVVSWTTVSANGVGALTAGARTINVDGFYMIQATITFPSGGTGFKRAQIMVNSSSVDVNTYDTSAAHNNAVEVAIAMPLHAGDTVAISAFQNSGATQQLTAGANQNHWSIVRIGAI